MKLPIFYELSKLLFIILLVTHIFACIFYKVAVFQINSGIENSWVQVFLNQNNSSSQNYVESFYFSLITMASIGYGDIHPNTILEKKVIIFLGIISTGFFAYALNTIGSIFREIE